MIFRRKKPEAVAPDLSRFSDEQLCEIYQTFNRWEWPELLGPQPKGDQSAMVRATMDMIQEKIGHRELLRWHWLHNLGETNEAFEKWYWAMLSNAVFSRKRF